MTSEEIIQIAKEVGLGLPPSIQTDEALALRAKMLAEEADLLPGSIEDLPTEL